MASSLPGLGFTGVGDANASRERVLSGLRRLTEIEKSVVGDCINVESGVRDAMTVIQEMFTATGRMLEQVHLRMMAMITTSNFGAVMKSFRLWLGAPQKVRFACAGVFVG